MKKQSFHIVQPTASLMLGMYDNGPTLDVCGKLPGTLALVAVLSPVRPHSIKSFLPPFYP